MTAPIGINTMDEAKKGSYEVGFGKPPRTTQFRPGQSGNPRGRPRGAKNFSTALEEELRTRISVTENGKRKKISKRQVIAKLLVNKAATGDLKAIPLLLNETRPHEERSVAAGPEEVFDTPEDRRVIDSVISRIRQPNQAPSSSAPAPQPADEPEGQVQPRLPKVPE